MRFIAFLLIGLLAYADNIIMEDGKCYEQKGKINYIVPCPKKTSTPSGKPESHSEKKEGCLFKLGQYNVEFINSKSKKTKTVSCDDSLMYIKSMHLGYDKSLSAHKIKIGDLVVSKGLSECAIGLYHGDFLTIGFMSGDRLLCDDFMVYHAQAGK